MLRCNCKGKNRKSDVRNNLPKIEIDNLCWDTHFDKTGRREYLLIQFGISFYVIPLISLYMS